MDRYTHIYLNEAETYDRMVSYEDYQGNLLPALQAICPLDGLAVVEFGAGTGRLTRLLAPHVASIRAFDDSQAMLNVAEKRLSQLELSNWTLAHGEHRSLPVESGTADMTIQGWSFSGYFSREGDAWQAALHDAIDEMERITRPGGTLVMIETLGTGNSEPRYSSGRMEVLFRIAEDERGFIRHWIRTDYLYESPQQAEELTRFFFGDELGDLVRQKGEPIVPECTGILWKRKAANS